MVWSKFSLKTIFILFFKDIFKACLLKENFQDHFSNTFYKLFLKLRKGNGCPKSIDLGNFKKKLFVRKKMIFFTIFYFSHESGIKILKMVY